VARERIDTFANAVSDELLAVEPAPDPPAGTLRLAVVGSWTARKGIEFGIPALTTLLERHPGTSAVLAGTAAGVEEVLARFPEALRPRIDVVPAYERAELPRLLRGAHVLLFPTLAEGQSLALLEGMACGLAPVTTPAGASTVARDDREALVVEPGDADALVAAVERLLSDPGRLGRLRARALETARRHTWARSAEEAEALYAGGLAELRP
jgi:glycosyltransferase involved in cell wall biosynthesis